MSQSYGYDALDRETSMSRGTLNSSNVANSPYPASWTLDSMGNKYGGPKYASSYNLMNQPTNTQNTFTAGNQTVVSLPAGNIKVEYDAWGRVVSSDVTQSGSASHSYSYDALGREISDTASGSGGGYTRELYDGTNLIEERNVTGNVLDQYVWSAAGTSTIILRDRLVTGGTDASNIPQIDGNTLNQRNYEQTDGQGNTTSITDINGNVVERYEYDQDGQPTAMTAGWGVTAASGTLQSGDSQFGWQFLYHGARYVKLLNSLPAPAGEVFSAGVGGGLYSVAAGAGWYNPYAGVSVQANYSSYAPSDGNPYDGAGMWAAGATVGAVTGIAVGAALITVGVLFPPVGIAMLAAGVLAGLNDVANREVQGQSLGQSFGGAAADLTGINGIYAGLYNQDIATHQNLGLNQFQQGQAFGGGAVQLAATLYGGYQLGSSLASGFAAASPAETVEGLAAQEGRFVGLTRAGEQLTDDTQLTCFIAGTQVVLAMEESDSLSPSSSLSNHSEFSGAGLAEATVHYLTKNVEALRAGDLILARNEFDPAAPLFSRRVEEVFERTAYQLTIVMLRSSTGREQTLYTTNEHPVYVPNRGWVICRELRAGDCSGRPI
jgi:YD repeat-containing protein